MRLLIFSLLLLATGCAGHRTAEPAPGTAMRVPAAADPRHGRQIFANKCAACHGANGQGASIGPTLRNERMRKNPAQTAAWIKDPDPPMPKLYPAELSAKDLSDVAAYVESL